MPTYFVKSRTLSVPPDEGLLSRSLVVDAHFFEHDDGNYNFFKDNRKLVASVPSRDVFAVVEEESYGNDYFFYPPDYEDLEDEEDDWVCDECLGADPEPVPVPQTPTAVPDARDESYPIEKWQTKDGRIWYGFHTPNGFVHFLSEDSAKWGRTTQRVNSETIWSYKDLTGAIKLEGNL